MHPRALVLLAAILTTASGCAGQRYNQELTRIKSDMEMLDQRVGQLERTSVPPPIGSLWPSDTAVQPLRSSSSPTSPSVSASAANKPAKTQIQQALKNAGFYQGPIDGKIGPKTREAIQEFQRVNGLKVDGVAGSNTWAKLSPYLDLDGSATANLTEPIK